MWWCNQQQYKWKYWWHHRRHSYKIWDRRSWKWRSTWRAYRWRANWRSHCSSTRGYRKPHRHSYSRLGLWVHWGSFCSSQLHIQWGRRRLILHSLQQLWECYNRRRGWRRRSLVSRSRGWIRPRWRAGLRRLRCIRLGWSRSRQWRRSRGLSCRSYSRFCPRSDRTSRLVLGKNGNRPFEVQSRCCPALESREFQARPCSRICSRMWT